MKKRYSKLMAAIIFVSIMQSNGFAMHIAEGFLPPLYAGIYGLISIPFVLYGVKVIREKSEKSPNIKMFIALAGAYCFMLSALKLPSVTGSSSHPTGVGFGAILLGPFAMSVIGLLVLVFQALFLAHGGFTTLGANTFSMGIVGPFVAYGVYRALSKFNRKWAIFGAAALGNLSTYVVTSIQLGVAFPSASGGVLESVAKFGTVFALTQIPLALAEGIMTVIMFNVVEKHSSEELHSFMEVESYES